MEHFSVQFHCTGRAKAGVAILLQQSAVSLAQRLHGPYMPKCKPKNVAQTWFRFWHKMLLVE